MHSHPPAKNNTANPNLLSCSLEDGFIILDNQHRIVGMNLVARKIFDQEIGQDQQVIGKKIDDLINSPEIKTALAASANKICPLETTIGDRTGHHYSIGITEIEKDSSPSQIKILILHNISREKELERLEKDIISITAHELRTPLTSTKWSLEMLFPTIKKSLKSDELQLFEQIYKSNKRLLTLVNDLLDLSAMEEGKFKMNPERVNFSDIINLILAELKVRIAKKNLTIKHPDFTATNTPIIMGDKDRLAQVVMNVLSNAVKYTPAGKNIFLSLDTIAAQKIPTAVAKDSTAKEKLSAQYLLFTVRDEGIGMDEEEQKKLFSKFFRATNVMNSEIEGTGLGLYITKQIMQLHHGFIWFTSKKDNGTTFYVALPLTPKR